MSDLGLRRWRSALGVLVAVTAMTVALAAPGTAGAVGAVGRSMSPVVERNAEGLMKSKVVGTTKDGRKVKGVFDPTGFRLDSATGEIWVDGLLDYRIVGKGKRLRAPEPKPVSFRVENIGAPLALGSGGPGAAGTSSHSCQILHLDLAPLNLELLGLQVDLSRVVLDIVANAGEGLLGDLLCAVANLLDGGPLGGLLDEVLGQITGLLEDILGALTL